MQQILSTYKDRLINISGRNRSLILRKNYKKRTFDLIEALTLQEQSAESFIDFLHSKMSAYTLVEDPFRFKKETLNKSRERLVREKAEEVAALNQVLEDKETMDEVDEALAKERLSDIDNKYNLLMADGEEVVDVLYEKTLSQSNALNYLYRETVAIEKETGKYELSIGFPFVEGRFVDGSFVRAPLLLYPVELIHKNNTWQLKKSEEREPFINKVFLYAAVKNHHIAMPDDGVDLDSWYEAGLEASMIQYLEDCGIVVEKDNEPYTRLPAYTNSTIPVYDTGQIVLKNHMILGQFPISNSIYTDYEYLESMDAANASMEQLLKSDAPSEAVESHTYDGVYHIVSMDHSQEQAVRGMQKGHQMVVYGPPGTGKSQTISNMISDAMARGKRVLMVSQKRAALDVLYNRLSPIQDKMMLIHDANNDKKVFYDKMRQCFEKGFEVTSHEMREAFLDIQTAYDHIINQLEDIEKALTEPRPFGLTLQELYLKTQGIFTEEDPRFELYRSFRENNPFDSYSYQELEKALRTFSRQPQLVDTYYRYAQMIHDYAFITHVQQGLDVMERHDVIDSVEQFYTDIDNEWMTFEQEYTVEVAKLYQSGNQRVDDNTLKRAAQELNHRQHEELLPEDKPAWWKVNERVVYMAHGKERRDNEERYERYEEATIQEFLRIGQWMNSLFEKLQRVQTVLNPKGISLIEKTIKEGVVERDRESLMEMARQLVESIQQAATYQGLNVYIHDLNALEVLMATYAYEKSTSVETMQTQLDFLLEFILLEHISEIEKEPGFNAFFMAYNRFEELVEQATHYMDEIPGVTEQTIRNLWNEKIQIFDDGPEMKELRRQCEKKRRLWPVRNLVFEFTPLMMTMFPCWLMSPETVSDILPLEANLFDVIIFDEASQMYVENAIPTVYRGRQVIVAGDDKQLRPTSAFLSRMEDDDDILELDIAAALEEESLLDLAKINYEQVHLNYHYRSRYEELIQFSNHAFYDARLKVAPNVSATGKEAGTAIKRIVVDGVWENRRNNVEANRVVELVASILQNRKEEETIGIITFNINQKDLIEDLMEARCQVDEGFATRYSQEIMRREKDEDQSLFVKNIENVQGDERDIIIFSVGYAPGPDGKLSVNFGSLSQDGGENRLNVAVSRAKMRTYVVTSIEPEILKVGKTKNRGAKLFKDYLLYAKYVSESMDTAKEQLLEQLSQEQSHSVATNDAMVVELGMRLEKEGLQVARHVGSGEHQIDLAIVDPETHSYILGIECDTSLYARQSDVLERDIYRRRFFIARQWTMMRVWSYDWWKNQDEVVGRILDQLKTLTTAQMDIIVDKSEEKAQFSGKSDAVCDYGDRVGVRDLHTKETFQILLDGNPKESESMNPFKRLLLGCAIGERVEYKGYEYIITGIQTPRSLDETV